ncbi:MAG TPA: arginine repressor [Gemmatimonadaceae bacterium]|nr:arginine repressor [Gemmatimonadaceae bacterium]
MANKRERQAAILEIVETRPVGSQEELRRLLRQRGWDVTQATLSRDLRDLRLARIPSPQGGVRYAAPEGGNGADDTRPSLDLLLPTLFRSVDGVSELAVLRTVVGAANSVAVSLDLESWPDILGTIAGDDTILIICRSSAARERIVRRIRSLAGEDSSQGR